MLDQSPDYSMAEIARSLGWLSEKVNERGQREPLKARVQRALGVLTVEKLADTTRGKWKLTEKGKNTAKALREKAF